MVEKYHPKFLHVKGLHNHAADVLSRLPMHTKIADTVDWEPNNRKVESLKQLCDDLTLLELKEDSNETLYDLEDSESQSKYFVSDKSWDSEFALDVKMFKEHQEKDQKLYECL